MNLLDLPPENICQILNDIHDTGTIMSLYQLGNSYLWNLATNCITEIMDPTPLPAEVLIKLKSLRSVKRHSITVKSLTELEDIAKLPKLKQIGFLIPLREQSDFGVSSFSELI